MKHINWSFPRPFFINLILIFFLLILPGTIYADNPFVVKGIVYDDRAAITRCKY